MKFFLSGYYGFGNVGDEAVKAALIKGIKEHAPKSQITVLSGKERYKPSTIFPALLSADVFISGGGTLFQNITSRRSFLYYAALLILAKCLGKRTVIFAQGFGLLRGKFYHGLARLVFRCADLITLRDREAVEEVLRLGIRPNKVHLTADPTAILEIPSTEEGQKLLSLEGIKKDAQPLVGIALRALPKGKENLHFWETLAEGIDWLSEKHHFYPVFFLFQPVNDLEISQKTANLLKCPYGLVFRNCAPLEMLALFSQMDLVLGMRLHALIFAALTNVPMLGLSYDPKVEAFTRSLRLPYLDVAQGQLDLEKFKYEVEEVLGQRAQIKNELAVAREELRKQAERNFELLFKNND